MFTSRQSAVSARALARVSGRARVGLLLVDPPPVTDAEAHVKAYNLALASGLEPAQAQAAAAIGWFESYYGIRKGFLLADGTPSYNWGALRSNSKDPETAFLGPQSAYWMRFGSMKAGFDRFMQIGSVRRAMVLFAQGDAVGGAAAMQAGGYWVCEKTDTREACIRKYAAAIVGAAGLVAKANGTKVFLNDKGSVPDNFLEGAKEVVKTPAGGALTTLVVGAAILGAVVYFSEERPRKKAAATTAPKTDSSPSSSPSAALETSP